jgi:hypothetical protein
VSGDVILHDVTGKIVEAVTVSGMSSSPGERR